MATVLQAAVDTENLPRYNMRRAASRPPPSARPRVLAKPQTESTLVQTTPSGPSPQTNEVVIALAQAAAAIAKEVAATGPEPLVAAVDLKHADLQQLVSSDLLLTLMPEAEPEDAAGEDLDVTLLSVDPVGAADASPLDAKPCAGRTSPTDVISAADGWSVPSRAEPLTPNLAPRDLKPWACAFPECTKVYSQRDGLRQHARKYHATWLRSNHTSFYRTSDEAEGKLWDCAEATGWCILDDSQPGRYLYVAPSGRVFTSKKAAEAVREQEETMMLRCDEQIDDLAEQIDSPVLVEALQSLCRASATVHTKKRKSVFGGGSTTATPEEHWTPLIAHSFPKTDAPTPPASPLRLVAHLSTREIRTVAWEEHSKPKHVLDEDMLGEGEAAARKHVS